MAGDANAGGGGSVYWSVDVDDVDNTETSCQDNGNGRYHQRGKDKGGAANESFTITLRAPVGMTADQYVAKLQTPGVINAVDAQHVQFTLPIEDNPQDKVQINVHWGGKVASLGKRALKTAHVAASPLTLAKRAAPKKTARPKKKAMRKPAARKRK